MPTNAARLAIAVLFASVSFAQPPAAEPVNRVLHFTHPETDRMLYETATDIRGITEIPEASVDLAQRTLTLHGTAAQVALAEWLVKQWESAAPAQQPSSPDAHEYHLGTADIVRVYSLNHASTPQVLQEIATVVRTISDIRRLFTYNTPAVITARGDASQIALAGWLVDQLDRPANQPPRTQDSHEYRPSGAADDFVRVFYTAHTASPRELQEIATDVRTIVDFRRLFTQNQSAALIVRGTAAQMSFAEWLVNQLDQPANQPPRTQDSHEYRPSGAADDVVRVFFLTHEESPERIQQIATEVRSATEVRRLFVYNKPRALTLRGTAAQIAMAGKLIAERDQ